MIKLTVEMLSQVITVLEEVRIKRVCCYGSKGVCDCKYGGGQIGDLHPRDGSEPQIFMGGEGCGCPELRLVIGLLRRMKVSEIQEISERERLR